jgi:hypothetical protein
MPRILGSFAKELFPKQIHWREGYAYSSTLPGLGVDFDEEIAEKRRVAPAGWPPLLRRDDGSFTNW